MKRRKVLPRLFAGKAFLLLIVAVASWTASGQSMLPVEDTAAEFGHIVIIGAHGGSDFGNPQFSEKIQDTAGIKISGIAV